MLCCAFHPQRNQVALGDVRGRMEVWDLDSNAQVCRVKVSGGSVEVPLAHICMHIFSLSLSFSPSPPFHAVLLLMNFFCLCINLQAAVEAVCFVDDTTVVTGDFIGYTQVRTHSNPTRAGHIGD